MKTSDVKHLPALERLAYWINEREAIRQRREAGLPAPWTDDEILSTYRFCNVRRMDDRVSRWLLENWYRPFYGHPNMVVACTVARFINLPRCLDIITPQIFPNGVMQPRLQTARMLLRVAAQNGPVFNGAYMITGEKGIDKVDSVFDTFAGQLVARPPIIDTRSIRRSVHALRQYHGMAYFMAGQIIADMRWAVDGAWEDRYEWAAMGPGSRRGMNRIHGRPLTYPIDQDEFVYELNELIRALKLLVPNSIFSRLEAIDWQNCLCEYDKYCRTLEGHGRPKSKFTPNPEPLP